MTAYVNEAQDDWDLHLPQLSYAYNSSVHGTTNATPFEVMLGRKPKLPIDLIYPRVESSHTQASNTNIPDSRGKPIELLEEYTHKLSQPAEDYIKNLRKHLAIIENIWL